MLPFLWTVFFDTSYHFCQSIFFTEGWVFKFICFNFVDFILFCQLPSRSARRKKAKRKWLRELKLEKEKVIWFRNVTAEVIYLPFILSLEKILLMLLMIGNLLAVYGVVGLVNYIDLMSG